MTKQQLKTAQENIESIREIAMAMLQSSDSNMIELAEILSDKALEMEMELCISEKDKNAKENSIKQAIDFKKLIEQKASTQCNGLTFEEWRIANSDAITEYIAKYPDNFTPDMTRYNMEMKIWIKRHGTKLNIKSKSLSINVCHAMDVKLTNECIDNN